MFQRRHYEKIAKILKEACKEMDIATIDHLVSTFIHYLYLDNKNFKLLFSAHGLPENKIKKGGLNKPPFN